MYKPGPTPTFAKFHFITLLLHYSEPKIVLHINYLRLLRNDIQVKLTYKKVSSSGFARSRTEAFRKAKQIIYFYFEAYPGKWQLRKTRIEWEYFGLGLVTIGWLVRWFVGWLVRWLVGSLVGWWSPVWQCINFLIIPIAIQHIIHNTYKKGIEGYIYVY